MTEELRTRIEGVNTDFQSFKAASIERDKTLFATLGRLEQDVKKLLIGSNSSGLLSIQHKVWFISGVFTTVTVAVIAVAWIISNIDKIQIVTDKISG